MVGSEQTREANLPRRSTKLKSTRAEAEKLVRSVVEKYPDLVIDALLGRALWPKEVQTKTRYTRMGDDNRSILAVSFNPDGDGHADCMCKPDPDLSETGYMPRFRTHIGGGTSPHTRTALLILARAIMLDELVYPQDLSQLDIE